MSVDNLKTPLEVLGLVEQAGLGISLGVGLRGVHITLAIHHLIVFPVDDRTSCHAYLERLRMAAHQVGRHESAEAPSVHTDTVGIDVGQRLQVGHTRHLVSHLHFAQLAEGGLLECLSSPLTAPVVQDEHQVALGSHVGFPSTQAPVPGCLHVVGMRTAIDVDDGGVFLLGVKTDGFHHAVIQVGGAIIGLDAATGNLRNTETILLPTVGSQEQVLALARLGAQQVDAAGYGGRTVGIQHLLAVGTEFHTVYAILFTYEDGLASLEAEAIDTAAAGVTLIAQVDDAAGLRVETHQVLYHPLASGELCDLVVLQVKEIEMVIPVTLTLHDSLGVVPGQERQRITGLDVFLIAFLQHGTQFLARLGTVGHQAHVVLVTVQFEDIERAAIGSPREVGVVVIGSPLQFQPYRPLGTHIIDTHLDLMALLAGHRIMIYIDLADAWEDIHLRITGHHALVKPVESQLLTVRTPEGALVDAELIPVDTGAIEDVLGTVGTAVMAHLLLLSLGTDDIEVALQGECRVLAGRTEIGITGLLGQGDVCHHQSGLEVHQDPAVALLGLHDGLVGIGKLEVMGTVGRLLGQALVELFHADQSLAGQEVLHLIGSGLARHVAPPGGIKILGIDIVGIAAHKVIEREVLLG